MGTAAAGTYHLNALLETSRMLSPSRSIIFTAGRVGRGKDSRTGPAY